MSLIVFLVGPTAIGKTEAAIKLAQKINAEIISCDSMQIYKGLDIITSKPPQILRKKIPHHLIDIVASVKEYNVSRYRKEALKKIKTIIQKGKIPLFVGGTGLYVSALVDGIFKQSAKQPAIRKQLYRQARLRGSEYLYARLKKVDPEAALKIHPHDTKRIIRALEVFKATGKPISKWQKERKGLSDDYQVRIFCLDIARDKLYRRIDARVERMFRHGLVAEVKKLLKLKLSKTASYAIGLKELKGYFNGEYDLAYAKELIKRNTRRYAKRQLTWFRKDKRIKWVEVRGKQSLASVADIIMRQISK